MCPLLQVWASGHDERHIIRAWQRRGIVPVAWDPAAIESSTLGVSGWETWDVNEFPCDSTGALVDDAQRVLTVMSALRALISMARGVESHPVPVYGECVGAGCDLLQALIEVVRLQGVHLVASTQHDHFYRPVASACEATEAETEGANCTTIRNASHATIVHGENGDTLLARMERPCMSHPLTLSSDLEVPKDLLPDLLPYPRVSLLNQQLEFFKRSTTPPMQRLRDAIMAGIPAESVQGALAGMLGLHPLSFYEALPWLTSPGASEALWQQLCTDGILTFVPEETARAPDAGLPEQLPSCGFESLLESHPLRNDRPPAIAFPTKWSMKTRTIHNSLRRVLSSVVVMHRLRPESTLKQANGAALDAEFERANHYEWRVAVPAEVSAYIAAGWNLQLSPASLPVSIPPHELFITNGFVNLWRSVGFSLLQSASKPSLFDSDPIELDVDAFGRDAVRIWLRAASQLFGGAKAEHDSTGRFAENAVAWLTRTSDRAGN